MKIIVYEIAAPLGHPDDEISVANDTITINGVDHDLSAVPEGGIATAEGDSPFAGPIRRVSGELIVPLQVHYNRLTARPNQPTDPEHWTVTITSGPLPDLIARRKVSA